MGTEDNALVVLGRSKQISLGVYQIEISPLVLFSVRGDGNAEKKTRKKNKTIRGKQSVYRELTDIQNGKRREGRQMKGVEEDDVNRSRVCVYPVYGRK